MTVKSTSSSSSDFFDNTPEPLNEIPFVVTPDYFTTNPFDLNPRLKEQQQVVVLAKLHFPIRPVPSLIGADQSYCFGKHLQLANGNFLKVSPSDFICYSKIQFHSIKSKSTTHVYKTTLPLFNAELPSPLFSKAIENKVKFTEATIKFSKNLRFSCIYEGNTAEFIIKIPDKRVYTLESTRTDEKAFTFNTSMRLLKAALDGSEDHVTFLQKIKTINLQIKESMKDSQFMESFKKAEITKDCGHFTYNFRDTPGKEEGFFPLVPSFEGAISLSPHAKRITIGEWGMQPLDCTTLLPKHIISSDNCALYTISYEDPIRLMLARIPCHGDAFDIIFDGSTLYILNKWNPGTQHEEDTLHKIVIPGLQKRILDTSLISASFHYGVLSIWFPVMCVPEDYSQTTNRPFPNIFAALPFSLSQQEDLDQIQTGRKTVIVVHGDAGLGNRFFLRESSNWEKGIELECFGKNLWMHRFEHISGENVAFKILLNDASWEIIQNGENRIICDGDQMEINPVFDEVVNLSNQMKPSSSSTSDEEILVMEDEIPSQFLKNYINTNPAYTEFFSSHQNCLSKAGVTAALELDVKNITSPNTCTALSKTRIVVRFDAGFGNFLTIRGNTLPLSWGEGIKMESIGSDLWAWECDQFNADFTCKFLLNDENWESTPDHIVQPGSNEEITPEFPSA